MFTKQNQEDYLIEKVLKLREQKAGNLIDETSEYKLGDFIHRAILGCPVPSSLNTMTEEEEYTDLWNDSAAIVISSLLEVASEVKSVDEIKKLIH